MEEIIADLEKKWGEIEQDIESNDIVIEENWSDKEIDKFVKGFQFAIDIAIQIVKEDFCNFYNDKDYNVKCNLYNETKIRYNDIDNLVKRIQNSFDKDYTIEINEEDKNSLCAILDTFDGVDLKQF